MKVGREMALGLWRILGVMMGISMAGGTLGWAADDLGVIPVVGELRTIGFPEPVEKILKNGLRVIVVERPGVPLLTVELVVKSGGEVDPGDDWDGSGVGCDDGAVGGDDQSGGGGVEDISGGDFASDVWGGGG
ncbi:MAG: hypothetical protein NTX04_12690 [Verrucomicrobia bacterium]|nr:hypothetical protein [Verrucomicrobiota bacterium]